MDIKGLVKPFKYVARTVPYQRRKEHTRVYGNSEILLHQPDFGRYGYSMQYDIAMESWLKYLKKKAYLDDQISKAFRK